MSGHARRPAAPLPLTTLELVGALLPIEEKGDRLVAVWKASFDESGPGQGEGWFVTAGVAATLRQWRSLAAAWRKTLRADPSIPLFHDSHKSDAMRERPGTLFHGWTKRAVEKKTQLLARVIRDHSQKRLVVAFREEDFTWAVSNCSLNKKYRNPYMFGLFGCLMATGEFMDSLEPPQEQPTLVFEQWGDAKRQNAALELYNEMEGGVPSDGPIYETCKWLRRQPLFEGNKDEVCSQVADLVAGKWRYALEQASLRNEIPRIPRVLGGKGNVRAYVWNHETALRWQRTMTDFLRKKGRRGSRKT